MGLELKLTSIILQEGKMNISTRSSWSIAGGCIQERVVCFLCLVRTEAVGVHSGNINWVWQSFSLHHYYALIFPDQDESINLICVENQNRNESKLIPM